MLDTLSDIDKALLLFVNGLHTPWLDQIMIVISEVRIWIPLYVFIAAFIVYQYGKRALTVIVAIALLIVIIDVSAAQLIKPLFGRMRPCHQPWLMPLLHLPAGCGGTYGFVSNHAANVFGLASFLWLMLKFRHPKIKYFFIWAFVVSISRVYLGKHFPFDITIGALYGSAWAFIVYRLYVSLSISYIKSDFFLRKWSFYSPDSRA
jgi:undecaprenyl-diphosphatase